jgi:hypothetical protein
VMHALRHHLKQAYRDVPTGKRSLWAGKRSLWACKRAVQGVTVTYIILRSNCPN